MPQLSAELRHFMMSLAAFWSLCKVVSSAVVLGSYGMWNWLLNPRVRWTGLMVLVFWRQRWQWDKKHLPTQLLHGRLVLAHSRTPLTWRVSVSIASGIPGVCFCMKLIQPSSCLQEEHSWSASPQPPISAFFFLWHVRFWEHTWNTQLLGVEEPLVFTAQVAHVWMHLVRDFWIFHVINITVKNCSELAWCLISCWFHILHQLKSVAGLFPLSVWRHLYDSLFRCQKKACFNGARGDV